MLSFNVATLVAAGKVLGPMSDPSVNRNLISNCSCTPDILQFLHRFRVSKHQDLRLGLIQPKESISNTSISRCYEKSRIDWRNITPSKQSTNNPNNPSFCTLVIWNLEIKNNLWVEFDLETGKPNELQSNLEILTLSITQISEFWSQGQEI